MQKVIGPDSSLVKWWESELKLVQEMFINLFHHPEDAPSRTDKWLFGKELASNE